MSQHLSILAQKISWHGLLFSQFLYFLSSSWHAFFRQAKNIRWQQLSEQSHRPFFSNEFPNCTSETKKARSLLPSKIFLSSLKRPSFYGEKTGLDAFVENIIIYLDGFSIVWVCPPNFWLRPFISRDPLLFYLSRHTAHYSVSIWTQNRLDQIKVITSAHFL
jgi:hypothetical protein